MPKQKPKKINYTFRTITDDEFFEEFKPIPKGKNGDKAEYGHDFGAGCCMFETFGADLGYIRYLIDFKKMGRHIWTVIDGDEGQCIESGVHLVNRMGYIVTEKPWQDDVVITVEWDQEVDDEEETEEV